MFDGSHDWYLITQIVPSNSLLDKRCDVSYSMSLVHWATGRLRATIRGVNEVAQTRMLDEQAGMLLKMRGIETGPIALPSPRNDSDECPPGPLTQLRDRGMGGPKAEFEIRDSRLEYQIFVQNEATKLLKTQRSIPDSGKSIPISSTPGRRNSKPRVGNLRRLGRVIILQNEFRYAIENKREPR